LKEDMGEASVSTPPPSRPPLKKRFTGTFQVPQAAPSTSSTLVKEAPPPAAKQRAPSPPIAVSVRFSQRSPVIANVQHVSCRRIWKTIPKMNCCRICVWPR
jgi:hypothetical protein